MFTFFQHRFAALATVATLATAGLGAAPANANSFRLSFDFRPPVIVTQPAPVIYTAAPEACATPVVVQPAPVCAPAPAVIVQPDLRGHDNDHHANFRGHNIRWQHGHRDPHQLSNHDRNDHNNGHNFRH